MHPSSKTQYVTGSLEVSLMGYTHLISYQSPTTVVDKDAFSDYKNHRLFMKNKIKMVSHVRNITND